MKHTLTFDVQHPRYFHTLILRRLGPGRWEVEGFTRDPADYLRIVASRHNAMTTARIVRGTYRHERDHLARLAERGRPPTSAELAAEMRQRHA